jgi:hypothetical protein
VNKRNRVQTSSDSISFVHLTFVLCFVCSLDVCTLFRLFTWRLYSLSFVHLTFVLYFFCSLDVCTLFRLFINEIEYKRQVNKRNRVQTSSEQTKESTNVKWTNEIAYKRQALDVCTLFSLFTWRLYSISFVHLTFVLYFVCSLDVCTLFRLFTWRLYSISFVHLTFVLYFEQSTNFKWTNEIEYKCQVNKQKRVQTSSEQTK